uniref:hypothetical protein n=1 Tax=Arthrobacter sp. Hiyo1 TaxID=1588020 RepID=UPI000750FC90|nr:hypothetical protein [Arthrobacter sp. Hiyo1]
MYPARQQVVAQGGQEQVDEAGGEDFADEVHGLDDAAHGAAFFGLPAFGEHRERKAEEAAHADAGEHPGQKEDFIVGGQPAEGGRDTECQDGDGEGAAPAEGVPEGAEHESAQDGGEALHRGDRDQGDGGDVQAVGDVRERETDQIQLGAVEQGSQQGEGQDEPDFPAGVERGGAARRCGMSCGGRLRRVVLGGGGGLVQLAHFASPPSPAAVLGVVVDQDWRG